MYFVFIVLLLADSGLIGVHRLVFVEFLLLWVGFLTLS